MINTLIGTKVGMTTGYDSRGRRVGITLVSVEPNYVTQKKDSSTKDGYDAVQLGMGSKKSLKKPQLGHLKKAGLENLVRFFREVKTEEGEDLSPGKEIKVFDVFMVGDEVKVTGTSKGKGFQGGVRRHGFAGGPKTHGQSDRLRAPGAIGSGTTPGRVLKGKRMAGHMGVERVSLTGLEVVEVDKNKNILAIKGALPGPVGGLVMIKKLGRIKGYIPPPEEKPSEESPSVESSGDKDQEAENAG